MQLSGIQKCTLLDYPDTVACIAFTPGCQFRCGYCHNPEFVLPQLIRDIKESFIPEEIFFRFLETRKGKLDGVVVTGGEPTIQSGLLPFLRHIKDMGFLVKLDTNGNNPSVLAEAIEKKYVDYIAMDIKTSLGAYKQLVGNRANESALAASIACIKNSGVTYEFRSTLIHEVHTPDIIDAMARLLQGARRLYLQSFRPGVTLNPLFQSFHPFSETEMHAIADIFRGYVDDVCIR
ncbi:MAG: anaerobic ribonucleoside-triphosphate reductase activating protein [Candidatus Magasanikbacteria bacterium]|jgi:pyruvate formate lyase activating enzyme|nr:anaerobic ribonucleoside-triphosphate reductase activating protein [Candidatus Magasanikbacteria bacterium]